MSIFRTLGLSILYPIFDSILREAPWTFPISLLDNTAILALDISAPPDELVLLLIGNRSDYLTLT